jgi:cysteine desulfurase
MGLQTRTYLDFNATAPLRPAARRAMLAACDLPGNASSVHGEGRAARLVIETARDQVAGLLGVPASAVIFTSGGTEAMNLALTPQVGEPGGLGPIDRLLVGASEHVCVLAGHRFAPDKVEPVAVLADGRLDLVSLERALNGLKGARVMLALQAANNETGVLQPVAEAAALVHAHGGLLVCDAVQAFGRMDCEASAFGADMLALSAHKLGGPKGAGALVLARPGLQVGAPLIKGGGQEGGARAGTENIAALAGFGAAALESRPDAGEVGRLRALREAAEAALLQMAPDAVIFGAQAPRLANTSAFAIPGISAETCLIALDLAGLAVSSGSACSSGKVRRSHVLNAMGVAPELAGGAVRLSLGYASTMADVVRFSEALRDFLVRARRRSAA